MNSDYKMRFRNIVEEVKSEAILNYARLENYPTSFTRKRKMPVDDIIISVLSRKGLSTAMDISDFFSEKGSEESISTQAYLKQRKKLNSEVFSHLNSTYLQNFYEELMPKDLYKGYIVLAVDGSKGEVPASKENADVFGEQASGTGVVRALVSCINDVFNKFTLDMQLGSIYDSESELAVENIKRAKKITGDIPIVVLFDRGYPGLKLMDCLDTMGIKYLFRLSSNDYKQERSEMKTNDEAVKLQHTYSRIAKIRKKHPEAAALLATKKYTEVRIVRGATPSGEEIAFVTNLTVKELTTEEVIALYFKRWNIEESYNTLKNKLRFESVTGEATIYVYQDFWAQLLVYNMIQDMLNSANVELAGKAEVNEYKHGIHANENIAIGLFKRAMIGLLLEEDSEKRVIKLQKLQKDMEKHFLPYRKSRGKKREFKKSNKNKRNLKRTF